MSSAHVFAPSGHNRLLMLLPEADREQVLAHAHHQVFHQQDVLIGLHRPTDAVYFPISFVGSVLTSLSDGTEIETGTVGNEGFIGIPVLLGVDTVPSETICQVTGEGLVLGVAEFRAILDMSAPLRQVLQLYIQHFLIQGSQSTACNRVHTIDQRYARMLLMMHDRAGRDDIYLTQEFLATMLGVRRASVSLAASALQEQGVIRYQRGAIEIVDRPCLEAASCECYGLTRGEYDRILGSCGSDGAPV